MKKRLNTFTKCKKRYKFAKNHIGMNIKKYFLLFNDLDNYDQAINSIEKNAVFSGASVWILIFAIFIASLGLNLNSTAVIIGAMLISPLMGPIIGMGLAVGIDDLDLLKKAIKNYLVATCVAVITATIYFLISPLKDADTEILARTSPTLYDVLIAFMGGAAGIIALSVKEKGNVLPGVAIATALMPPLCTAGFGIAQGNIDYFIGAFFLYFINTVFIALATFIGTKLMKFPVRKHVDPARRRLVHRTLITVVVLTMIPAAFMTWGIVKKSYFNNQVQNYIHKELSWDGTQVLTHDVSPDSILHVVVIGRIVDDESLMNANKAINDYPMLVGYSLNVLQGTESDSLVSLSNRVSNMSALQTKSHELLKKEAQENKALGNHLSQYLQLEELSKELAPEMKILFPEITSLSLSSTLQVNTTDSLEQQRMTTALIGYRGAMPKISYQEQIKKWLEQRTQNDSLEILYVPEK